MDKSSEEINGVLDEDRVIRRVLPSNRNNHYVMSRNRSCGIVHIENDPLVANVYRNELSQSSRSVQRQSRALHDSKVHSASLLLSSNNFKRKILGNLRHDKSRSENFGRASHRVSGINLADRKLLDKAKRHSADQCTDQMLYKNRDETDELISLSGIDNIQKIERFKQCFQINSSLDAGLFGDYSAPRRSDYYVTSFPSEYMNTDRNSAIDYDENLYNNDQSDMRNQHLTERREGKFVNGCDSVKRDCGNACSGRNNMNPVCGKRYSCLDSSRLHDNITQDNQDGGCEMKNIQNFAESTNRVAVHKHTSKRANESLLFNAAVHRPVLESRLLSCDNSHRRRTDFNNDSRRSSNVETHHDISAVPMNARVTQLPGLSHGDMSRGECERVYSTNTQHSAGEYYTALHKESVRPKKIHGSSTTVFSSTQQYDLPSEMDNAESCCGIENDDDNQTGYGKNSSHSRTARYNKVHKHVSHLQDTKTPRTFYMPKHASESESDIEYHSGTQYDTNMMCHRNGANSVIKHNIPDQRCMKFNSPHIVISQSETKESDSESSNTQNVDDNMFVDRRGMEQGHQEGYTPYDWGDESCVIYPGMDEFKSYDKSKRRGKVISVSECKRRGSYVYETKSQRKYSHDRNDSRAADRIGLMTPSMRDKDGNFEFSRDGDVRESNIDNKVQYQKNRNSVNCTNEDRHVGVQHKVRRYSVSCPYRTHMPGLKVNGDRARKNDIRIDSYVTTTLLESEDDPRLNDKESIDCSSREGGNPQGSGYHSGAIRRRVRPKDQKQPRNYERSVGLSLLNNPLGSSGEGLSGEAVEEVKPSVDAMNASLDEDNDGTSDDDYAIYLLSAAEDSDRSEEGSRDGLTRRVSQPQTDSVAEDVESQDRKATNITKESTRHKYPVRITDVLNKIVPVLMAEHDETTAINVHKTSDGVRGGALTDQTHSYNSANHNDTVTDDVCGGVTEETKNVDENKFNIITKAQQSKKIQKTNNDTSTNVCDNVPYTPGSSLEKQSTSQSKKIQKVNNHTSNNVCDNVPYTPGSSVEKQSTSQSKKIQKVNNHTSNNVCDNVPYTPGSSLEKQSTAQSKKIQKTSDNLTANDAVSNDASLKPRYSIEGQSTSQNKTHLMYNWAVIPSHCGRTIIVDGRRRQDDPGVFWKSSKIAHRISARVLQTTSGATYILKGKMDTEYSDMCGVPPEFRKKFTRGFPVHWKQMATFFYYSRKIEKPEVSSELTPAVKTPKTPKPVNSKRTVGKVNYNWQAAQLVKDDVAKLTVTDLPRSSRGRVITPLLASWAGQRVTYDSCGEMQIVSMSPNVDPALFTVSLNKFVRRNPRAKDKQSLSNISRGGDPSTKPKPVKVHGSNGAKAGVSMVEQPSRRVSKPSDKLTRKSVNGVSRCDSGNNVEKRAHKESKLATTVVPKDSGKVIEKSDVCPIETESVPFDSEMVAQEREVVEIQSEVIPKQSKVLSKQSELRSKQSGVIPKQSQVTPHQAGLITNRTNVESDLVREDSEVVPQQYELCPRELDVVHEQSNVNSNQSNVTVNTIETDSLNNCYPRGSVNMDADEYQSSIARDSADNCVMANAEVSVAMSADVDAPEEGDGHVTIERRSERIAQQRSMESKSTASGREEDRTTGMTVQRGGANCSEWIEVPGDKEEMSSGKREAGTKNMIVQKDGVRSSKGKRGTKETSVVTKIRKSVKRGAQSGEKVKRKIVKRTRNTKGIDSQKRKKEVTKRQVLDKAPADKVAAMLSPLKLKSKPGTLRRKKELRLVLTQINANYEDDLFDSTPLRKKHKSDNYHDMSEGDDSFFGNKLPFETPKNNGTPALRVLRELETHSKTPTSVVTSDSSFTRLSVGRADRYMIKLKNVKRPKLVTALQRTSITPVRPGTSWGAIKISSSLLVEAEASVPDSDASCDDYWSDTIE